MSTPLPSLTAPVMTPDERKRGVRRSAFWMSMLALAVYGGFILMAVLRSS